MTLDELISYLSDFRVDAVTGGMRVLVCDRDGDPETLTCIGLVPSCARDDQHSAKIIFLGQGHESDWLLERTEAAARAAEEARRDDLRDAVSPTQWIDAAISACATYTLPSDPPSPSDRVRRFTAARCMSAISELYFDAQAQEHDRLWSARMWISEAAKACERVLVLGIRPSEPGTAEDKDQIWRTSKACAADVQAVLDDEEIFA